MSHKKLLPFKGFRALKSVPAAVALFLGPGLAAWGAMAVGLPAKAQPSGAVERRFQDQQLRDQLQELDRQQQRDAQERFLSPTRDPVTPPTDASPTDQELMLQKLELQGSASLPEGTQQELQRQFVGKPLNAALLKELRQAVVVAYERHKILVIVAPPRSTAGGEVIVPVLEARLGQVVVETNQSPVRSNWARDTVLASLQPGSVIRLDKLESALIKLNDLGGLRASATLKPGAQSGSSDVVLTLEAAKRYNATFNLNNELSQYTGVAQLEGIGTAASWLGLGDL